MLLQFNFCCTSFVYCCRRREDSPGLYWAKLGAYIWKVQKSPIFEPFTHGVFHLSQQCLNSKVIKNMTLICLCFLIIFFIYQNLVGLLLLLPLSLSDLCFILFNWKNLVGSRIWASWGGRTWGGTMLHIWSKPTTFSHLNVNIALLVKAH